MTLFLSLRKGMMPNDILQLDMEFWPKARRWDRQGHSALLQLKCQWIMLDEQVKSLKVTVLQLPIIITNKKRASVHFYNYEYLQLICELYLENTTGYMPYQQHIPEAVRQYLPTA